MTVVTFALPDESRDFLARLQGARRIPSPEGPFHASGQLGGEEVIVFHTGVGDTPAQRDRLARVLGEHAGTTRRVIVSGFAGALRPGIPVGDLVIGENHTDPALINPARGALTNGPVHVGLLVTRPVAVETVADKAALHAASGALAVDMETAWVVAVVAAGGAVPTLSLRVISDAADQSFPVPGGVMFDPVRQRPRYVALPAYLLTHPTRIAPFVRFVRGLGPARARLAAALEAVIDTLATAAS